MNTSGELVEVADELEGLARRLFRVERGLTGRPTERPTHELARSVAYWMIALRRLATTGSAAWTALDERFPPEPADGPPPAYRADEGPAELISELDVVSAFVTGDMVLDDLAYAELVRRDRVPAWTAGGNIPPMWPAFVRDLEGTSDPMLGSVRYLDLTLAQARDVLVAHRDPTLWYMPGFSSWGEVTLSRLTLDEERRRQALEVLREVEASLPHRSGYGTTDDYMRLMDYLLAIAPRLDKAARDRIRDAYALAGFESPNIVAMVRPTIRLVTLHVDLLPKLPELD